MSLSIPSGHHCQCVVVCGPKRPFLERHNAMRPCMPFHLVGTCWFDSLQTSHALINFYKHYITTYLWSISHILIYIYLLCIHPSTTYLTIIYAFGAPPRSPLLTISHLLQLLALNNSQLHPFLWPNKSCFMLEAVHPLPLLQWQTSASETGTGDRWAALLPQGRTDSVGELAGPLRKYWSWFLAKGTFPPHPVLLPSFPLSWVYLISK